MKKRINVNIDNGFIVTVEGLKKMHDFLILNYKELEVEGKLINGEDVDFDSLEELINYDNYNDNKIVRINLYYNNSFEDSFKISFSAEYDFFIFSNNYTINSNDLKKFTKIREQIKKIVKNEFKQWYSILTKDIVYRIINYIFLLFGIIYIISVLKLETKGELNKISILFLPIIIISLPFYQKMWGYLFPKGIFAIGKQKNAIKFYEKIREIFFIIIGLGIIVSLVASFIFKEFN